MEQLFFELLQVAIGNRKSLSRTPSVVEWGELYTMATRQTLVGICFVAVQKLKYACGVTAPDTLYMQWLGMAVMVQQQNRLMNEECGAVTSQLMYDGIESCVLKGQGNLVNYPDGLRELRTPGDIDVWCWLRNPRRIKISALDFDGRGLRYEYYTGARGVIEYALMLARVAGRKTIPKVRYNHVELPDIWKVDVEIHHRPAFLYSPICNRRLQKWFMAFRVSEFPAVLEGFCVPSSSFNAVYQLVHIYMHLFDKGVGLRQLLDYYFVLKTLHIEQNRSSNVELMHTISRLGMRKFAGAVMYVLRETFGMPEQYLICPVDEKEGRFLLNEIMTAGNFGKYDERIKKTTTQGGYAWEKLKHNMRLVTHYPKEVICEPFFRFYHYLWRLLRLWRFE